MPGDEGKTREELLRELRSVRCELTELKAGARSRTIAFDGLLDSLGAPVYIKDARHRWVYCNQAFLDLMGLPLEALLGRSADEIFPPEEIRAFHEANDQVLATGESRAAEESLTIRGVTHRMRTVKSFWRDPLSGEPLVLGVIHDVTESHAAMRALEESERKYRLLAENVEDVIFLADENLQFSYVSPSVYGLLGLPPERVRGQSVQERLTPESLERVREARILRRSAEARGEMHLVNRLELEMYRGDGSTVWVEVITKGLRDGDGRSVGLVGLARNISERRRMELQLVTAKEAAESASRAKSEFLANVSHEIRTPLNGMLGMLQLLQGGGLDPDNAEMIDTALECGRGLVALINDILDLSQIEAGVVRLHPREFDLDKTLDSVLAVFEHQAASRGLHLTREVTPGTPLRLLGDEGRLRQVLFNLVGNAMKFTETGGVSVAVHPLPQRRADGRVRLLFSVRDTGIGIPDDRVGDVFENFTQVDGSFTRRYSGAGLGLAIVRRLVRLLGGGVVLDTEQGRGTEIHFSLLFEVVDPDVRWNPESLPPGEPGKSARLRVLLAEDDRVGRLAVCGLLERLGHECVAVECGGDAVRELLRGGYHCALLDIQMPDMSGLDVVRLVRERFGPEAAPPPLVALTAHAMHGDREAFLAAGMDGYLAKPVDQEELRELLDGLAMRPDAPQAPK